MLGENDKSQTAAGGLNKPMQCFATTSLTLLAKFQAVPEEEVSAESEFGGRRCGVIGNRQASTTG